jgi:hypothetical protein
MGFAGAGGEPLDGGGPATLAVAALTVRGRASKQIAETTVSNGGAAAGRLRG